MSQKRNIRTMKSMNNSLSITNSVGFQEINFERFRKDSCPNSYKCKLKFLLKSLDLLKGLVILFIVRILLF